MRTAAGDTVHRRNQEGVPMTEWKFKCVAVVRRAGTGAVVHSAEAIIRSDTEDERSPFCCEGVGPIAFADERGTLRTWFVTRGNDDAISAPSEVRVFLRVAPGAWQPYPARVVSSRLLSEHAMELDLAELVIEQDRTLYVG